MADLRLSGMGGIPFGASSNRPANQTGQPYFNGEIGRLELYTTSGWQNIVQETPSVAGISGVYSEATNSGTIVISGTNFTPGAIASAIGTNSIEVTAASTTFNSAFQLTAVFTGLSAAYEPYDIKVLNPSNLYNTVQDLLFINNMPVWSTAAGSLGTFGEQVSISVSATATDSDSSTITYSLASGSSLPTGITLNSSTGAITGTLPDISVDTIYSFTINASDGVNIVPRTFSITSIAQFAVQYLVIAGGGAGGQDTAGGGGAGGYRSSVTGEMSGGGASAESPFTATSGSSYTVTVGAGGTRPGTGTVSQGTTDTDGKNSIFATITSIGGGGGVGSAGNQAGRSGGSGGGGYTNGAGSGTSGQGYGGYAASSGGGGGGAGAAATNINGGNGVTSSITGTAVTRAGGGGGQGSTAGSGGSGGGGYNTGYYASTNSGAANTGSGGSAYSGGWGGAGDGGSGIVILKYPNTKTISVSAGLTYSTSTAVSGYKVTSFTAGTGTVSWS